MQCLSQSELSSEEKHTQTHTTMNTLIRKPSIPPSISLTSRHGLLRTRFASHGTNQHLKSVLHRHHIGVDVLLELERVGDDLETPCALGTVGTHLEADPEMAWVSRHAAESVHGACWVGGAVVLEPSLC